MIPIKQAVDTAFNFFDSLYGQNQLRGLLLEEVKLAEDETEWYVILGFDRPQASFSIQTPQEPGREYKLIIIDAQTSEPKSLTIYKP